jgi:hypothetical protein
MRRLRHARGVLHAAPAGAQLVLPRQPRHVSLKQALIAELNQISGFEARHSHVAGGTALFYRGKEFAHFHHDQDRTKTQR